MEPAPSSTQARTQTPAQQRMRSLFEGWRLRPEARRSRCEQARVRRALAYIDGHLDDELGTTALARHCGLSVRRLARGFGAAVGIPLHRYVAYRRLERARRLFVSGALPLFDGAASLPASLSATSSASPAALALAALGVAALPESGNRPDA